MTDVLIIRPENDDVEKTLAVWCDLTLPPGLAAPAVLTVTELRGTAATATAVQSALAAGGDIVLYFGHATETTLGLWTTLVDTVTVKGAQGQVMIAIACKAADTFGPSAVAAGALAGYLGFNDILFVYNGNPAVIGHVIADRIRTSLHGGISLRQTADDIVTDLKDIESLFRDGSMSTHVDAAMIWMGAHINWRGLEVI